jgi:hypothetical protein
MLSRGVLPQDDGALIVNRLGALGAPMLPTSRTLIGPSTVALAE